MFRIVCLKVSIFGVKRVSDKCFCTWSLLKEKGCMSWSDEECGRGVKGSGGGPKTMAEDYSEVLRFCGALSLLETL